MLPCPTAPALARGTPPCHGRLPYWPSDISPGEACVHLLALSLCCFPYQMAVRTRQRTLTEDWELFRHRRFLEEQVRPGSRGGCSLHSKWL